MIRLIASDLDGTLLQNGSQELDSRLIPMIEQLTEMGILFAAASGRQLPNLMRLFAPVKDDIAYVAENGAVVMYRGTVYYKASLERSLGEAILRDIQAREGCEILLSGMNTSYLQPKTEEFEHHMRHIVKNDVTVVDNILDVEEDFFKISVCEGLGIGNSEQYFKETWGEQVKVVTSGNIWLDMVPKGVHKGTGIQALLDAFQINKEEFMAFGDHYNDVEMLEMAGESYALANAQPGIRALCRHETACVEDTLAQFIRESQEDLR